ncbi:hypothetical protein [Psychromonas sp. GE-S-Ul-11]|uniref:hypothetical protein n=1 Tax=Psychromonas sp. GE-S-Ul-11 TaxID=3241170 RepID=UPI00390CA40D
MDFMFRHFLIKYSEAIHIENFIKKGQMCLQPLSYYRNSEHNEEVGDLNEGAHKVKAFSKATVSRVLDNGETELVGEITDGMHREFSHEYASLSVYCLYYLIIPVNEYKNELDAINENLLNKFGGSAIVIYNLESFFERLDNYLKSKSLSYKRQSIEYIDIEKHTQKLTPFQKDNKYEHQNELRLAVINEIEDGRMLFEIGNLGDIAYTVTTGEQSI